MVVTHMRMLSTQFVQYSPRLFNHIFAKIGWEKSLLLYRYQGLVGDKELPPIAYRLPVGDMEEFLITYHLPVGDRR